MTTRALPTALGAFAALLLCACGAEDADPTDGGAADLGLDGGGGAGGGGACDVPLLFEQKCGGSICHGSENPAAELDLVSPGLEDRVSLQPGAQCPGTLADPSDPTASSLYTKVAGVPSCGSRMPLAAPPLDDHEIACVRDWISGLVPPEPPELDLGPLPDGGPGPDDMYIPPDMARPMTCEPGETEPCYDGPGRTEGVGACVAGERTCDDDGAFGPCEGQVVPGVEDCRTADIDEDCNGVTPACATTWSFGFGAGDGTPQNGRSVVTDAEGNVYMAGDFEGTVGFGGEALTADGDKADIVLAKYDRFGNPLWARRYGDSSNQYASQLAIDADGAVFMMGRAFGTITFGGPVHDGIGTDDIFIVKFDPDGAYAWSRMVGGLDPDRAERLVTDAAGDLYITGTFTGRVDFGSGPFESAGLRDAFVLKLDGRTGAHLYSKQIGGPGDDYGFGVAALPDGDVLITGRFEETITIDRAPALDSAGGRDIYLARLDDIGQARWSRRYGGPGEDAAHDLAARPDGSYVLHGAITGDVDFDDIRVVGAGERDIFLAAFDPDDTVAWAAAYGDASDQYETDFDTNTWSALALGPDGDIHLAGPLAGVARFGQGPVLRSAGRTDIYVVKLDADGGYLWGNRYGTDNTEIALDLAVAPDGHVVVTGRVFGTRGVDFGASGQIESHGSADGFVFQVRP